MTATNSINPEAFSNIRPLPAVWLARENDNVGQESPVMIRFPPHSERLHDGAYNSLPRTSLPQAPAYAVSPRKNTRVLLLISPIFNPMDVLPFV